MRLSGEFFGALRRLASQTAAPAVKGGGHPSSHHRHVGDPRQGIRRERPRSKEAENEVKALEDGEWVDTLSVSERLLLFCVASGTKPANAGTMHRTIEHSIIKGLIKRERCAPGSH
jgi:hypothetical protein